VLVRKEEGQLAGSLARLSGPDACSSGGHRAQRVPEGCGLEVQVISIVIIMLFSYLGGELLNAHIERKRNIQRWLSRAAADTLLPAGRGLTKEVRVTSEGELRPERDENVSNNKTI